MPKISAALLTNAAPQPLIQRIDWSQQQLAIFSAVRHDTHNLLVKACAGSGKTTTLIGACEHMDGDVAFCAYNKRISDEIKARTAHISRVSAGTFHSFGFGALREIAPAVTVDGKKLYTLQDELRQPIYVAAAARQLCSIAKQAGLGATLPADDQSLWEGLIDHFGIADLISEENRVLLIECAAALLEASSRVWDEIIDFDDMLYLPLKLNLAFRQHDWVLIDEAQDTNEMRRVISQRMLSSTGRVIVVGDRYQAIYGFTGADADAMDRLSAGYSCVDLPLSVTYRCARSIVSHAQQWMPDIEAAPNAPEGIVREISYTEFAKLDAVELRASDACLCRLTRPLVSEALRLIRAGIGARVEGRDIGQGLISITKKWKSARTLSDLEERLHTYRDAEVAKARAKQDELAEQAIEDKVGTLLVIIDSLDEQADIYTLQRRILDLFGDTLPGEKPKVITFSTVHKAKGREWDRVYLLGRNRFMPSAYARQQWQLEQERNLIYVAVTRAKTELIEVIWPTREDL